MQRKITTITGQWPRSVQRLGITAISLAAALVCGAGVAQPSALAYVPGRILAMPRAGMPDAALDKLVKENGGSKARRVGQSELRIIDVPPGLEKQVVDKLARHPHFKFAELDALSLPEASTNDPYLGSQWHLSKIGAISAWDQSQGTGQTIAIIDTGVDSAHPDLAPRLVSGWNFFNNSSDTSDAYNHGTGVAGSAAAAMNNALGVAGVAGQTKIMPIRISDASGSGSLSAMAQGLTYAADRGVRIANISFSSAARSSSVISAAQYMKNKGGLVFVSAGNTGTTATGSPTSAMIVVSATTSSDTRASWSTYGPVVSLAAPGEGIYTTTKGGGYVSENGTSFAAPVAAGVAALVMSANPSLTSSQVESILFSTSVDLGAAGRDDYYGYGRINAYQAIQESRATSGATDTVAPTAALGAPLGNSTVGGIVTVTPVVSDNVAVTKVELRVNGSLVASDTTSPFGFAWDSTKTANGGANIVVTAFDAAGNVGASASVAVNVANNLVADTVAPVVVVSNPANGSKLAGTTLNIQVSASDDRGAAGLTQVLYVDGKQVASATGGSLSYKWSTRKVTAGAHTLRAVARDAAGNSSETTSTVYR